MKVLGMKLTKQMMFSIICLSLIVFFILKLYLLSISCLVVLFFTAIAIYINKCINKRIIDVNPSIFTESRRNFDYLIIGDLNNEEIKVPNNLKYLKFEAPDRTLFASYIILRNRFSWLREDGRGTCIIVVKKKNNNLNRISPFDIPFLHPIEIKKYQLYRQQKKLRYPILYLDKSLRFLFGSRKDKAIRVACPNEEIVRFCNERNINLIYKES